MNTWRQLVNFRCMRFSIEDSFTSEQDTFWYRHDAFINSTHLQCQETRPVLVI